MEIIIAGDYCDRFRVSETIVSKKYNTLFSKGILDAITQSDYAIVNFEFPIVRSEGSPISKCGPNLKGSLDSVEAIKFAGFGCCTLANNHTLDQGEKCGIETREIIEEAGLDTIGFGLNALDASKTLYKRIGGKILAIINCCEHEFSVATESRAGANGIDPIRQYHCILEAKQKADYVLVITHGGHEHFNLPSLRMKELYRFFIEIGADAVINHHQHCYSGYEVYQGKPIFYGIGNFLFDNPSHRNSFWNYGYMVKLIFDRNELSFVVIPYSQCREKACVELLTDTEQIVFKEQLMTLNDIITDDLELKNSLSDYYTKSATNELAILEPYSGRVMSKLLGMKLVPRFIKNKKVPAILNHVECESHRDKLIFALTNKNK